jgi:preprotein translocase subunit SecY
MNLPEVRNPIKKGTLKDRLLWTFGMLVLFLFLASIPLYGVSGEQADYFKTLELLLGAKIGTLLTLGIGPIVTSSIVLQLLKGAGMLKFDMQTEEGKFLYGGTHKLLTFAFVIVQSIVYVMFGAVAHDPAIANSFLLLVVQLALGGFLVVYMDEVVKKWGFGSGVSLFIAAGIGGAVFVQLFSPFNAVGDFSFADPDSPPVGKFWQMFIFLQAGNFLSLATEVITPIAVTVGLLFLIVFFQAINVEIPLSFGRVKGQGFRWPLNFFYAGVIPVILISALSANLQLWARLLQSAAESAGSSGFTRFMSENILGQYEGQTAISGLVHFISPVNLIDNLSTIFTLDVLLNVLVYTIFLVIGSTVFAYFWVQTAGMDSRSQAQSILRSGLQIPGFRKDVRIIEKVLDRYIVPLTFMGGIGIGLLASFADLFSALTSGTGILLLVMIIYQFYQQLAKESMEDFSLLRKFMRK